MASRGSADDARRADIGRALAGQLASLSIEPLFVDDRILLGVLATKMADVDAVENVSILTIDERVIAEAGVEGVEPGGSWKAVRETLRERVSRKQA